jgi:hypothetical protein
MQKTAFLMQQQVWVAGWLRRFPQAHRFKAPIESYQFTCFFIVTLSMVG